MRILDFRKRDQGMVERNAVLGKALEEFTRPTLKHDR